MEILSHRGFWLHPEERNLEVAFQRSFHLGIGTETDLRDHDGEIVVAHDPPNGSTLPFRRLLDIMDGRNLKLALNIKADGLANDIREILNEYGHNNYFTFDMSLPEQVRQIDAGLTVFTGLSDIQRHAPLLETSAGIWVDCFKSDWYDASIIDGFLESGKEICLVSAELHKREPLHQWSIIRNMRHLSNNKVMICTDRPLEAKSYFGEQNGD